MKTRPHLFSDNHSNILNLILQFGGNIFTKFKFDAIYKDETVIIEIVSLIFQITLN